MNKTEIPIVAIVGRPNVGKSTLFNRLSRKRKALVLDKPGMTRDRLFERVEMAGQTILLIDTGGLWMNQEEESLLDHVRRQAESAIEEADVVIFLTDVNEPANPDDKIILEHLRKSTKPFIVVVNKCDTPRYETQANEFWRMGVTNIIPVSAEHGRGTSELEEALADLLPPKQEIEIEEDEQEADIKRPIRVAIVGRQNVGKSTLVNRILGQERVIADPTPGTTRDAIDTPFEHKGKQYVIVDTAGIRRRGKIERGAEGLSVFSALRSMSRCDIAVLVIDATEGITAQDQHIAGYILEANRACMVVVNKWDLVEKQPQISDLWKAEIKGQFQFLTFAPVLYISAKTGKRMDDFFPVMNSVYEEYHKKIDTPELNKVLDRILQKNPPPVHKGRDVKMKYIVQTGSAPPRFTIFVNFPAAIHFSYERFLKNYFRRVFGFTGSPIIFKYQRKSKEINWGER